jgi:hypothetical protein
LWSDHCDVFGSSLHGVDDEVVIFGRKHSNLEELCGLVRTHNHGEIRLVWNSDAGGAFSNA